MKHLRLILFLLIAFSAVLFTACPPEVVPLEDDPFESIDENTDENDVPANPSSTCELISFTFRTADNSGLSRDVTAEFDDTDVTIILPYGTALENLKAAFTHNGSSVSLNGTPQTSGTSTNDFTDELVYTVTAEDGSSRDYYVLAINTYSSDARMGVFGFAASENTEISQDTSGIFDHDAGTITVILPGGTDLSALTAVVTTVGREIRIGDIVQDSHVTVNDFSEPLVYTAVAMDGTEKNYTVTVYYEADENLSAMSEPGDKGSLYLPDYSAEISFILANNTEGMEFPINPEDDAISSVSRRYMLGETELTNAEALAILDWADNEFLISILSWKPVYATASTVMAYGRELIDLDSATCHIEYSASTYTFSIEPGYEDYPLTDISWYGAVMLCSWLTMMRDGSTDNLVYVFDQFGDDEWISSSPAWEKDETSMNTGKNGYRLPSIDEWELAARYIGDFNGDADICEPGEYYPGTYASGADTAFDVFSGGTDFDLDGDVDYITEVAWSYSATYPSFYHANEAGILHPNKLGLFDMSGNVGELCCENTDSAPGEVYVRGGSWNFADSVGRVGRREFLTQSPELANGYSGLRLCRIID